MTLGKSFNLQGLPEQRDSWSKTQFQNRSSMLIFPPFPSLDLILAVLSWCFSTDLPARSIRRPRGSRWRNVQCAPGWLGALLTLGQAWFTTHVQVCRPELLGGLDPAPLPGSPCNWLKVLVSTLILLRAACQPSCSLGTHRNQYHHTSQVRGSNKASSLKAPLGWEQLWVQSLLLPFTRYGTFRYPLKTLIVSAIVGERNSPNPESPEN